MLISYAQNFEDVMLWRALKHVDKGRYIDIGAQGPVIDSVSKFFHEQGWQGVHVEPTPTYAEQLRRERQGDIVLQAAVGNKIGTIKFYEFPDTGLSTDDRAIAKKHLKGGFPGREIVVPCITLDHVFSHVLNEEIHWLKIDVEGGEQRVLKSWLRSKARPWIVLVESTLPLTQQESYQKWESLLVAKGYQFAYFDGLNRFYVADKHVELINAFSSGPNLFDEFVLSRNSWPWGANLNFQLQTAEENLGAEKRAAAAFLQQRETELRTQLDELAAAADQRERASIATHAELMGRLSASQQSVTDAINELENIRQAHGVELSASRQSTLDAAQKLATREAELNAKLTSILEESTRLAHAFSERELEFAKQLAINIEASKAELLLSRVQSDEIQRALTGKEHELIALRQEFKSQVATSAQEIAQKEAQASAQYRELKDNLGSEIAQLRTNLATNAELSASREQAFEAQLQASRRQTFDAIEGLAVREREFAAQLQAREGQLRSEISLIAAEKSNLQVAVMERDERLVELRDFIERETASFAETAAKKERFLSETLASHEQQLRAEMASVELKLAHTRGQLDALGLESLSLRKELAKSRYEATELTVRLSNSGSEMVSLRQAHAKSESDALALAAKLANQEQLVSVQAHAAQTERERLLSSSVLREQQMQQQINDLKIELTYVKEIERGLSGQLRDVSGTLQARNSQLAALRRVVTGMADSVSWRLTAPLRAIGTLLGQSNRKDLLLNFGGESDNGIGRQQSLGLSHTPTIDSSAAALASAVIIQNGSTNDFESHHMKSDEIRYRDMAILNGADFVENCYRQLLNRPSDETGKTGYIRELNLGRSKAEIIHAILTSEEGTHKGARVEGLWWAILLRRLEQLPFVGGFVAIFALLINSKAMLRSARASESLAATSAGLQKLIDTKNETDNFQQKFDQLASAFLHTISSANTFMHESRQRLDEIENLLNGTPLTPSSAANSTNERLIALEKLSASRAALLDDLQRLFEPLQNLVKSVPLASRANARTMAEMRFQLEAVELHLRTVLPNDPPRAAEKKVPTSRDSGQSGSKQPTRGRGDRV